MSLFHCRIGSSVVIFGRLNQDQSSRFIRRTDESTMVIDSSVLLMYHDPRSHGSLILIQITPKQRTIISQLGNDWCSLKKNSVEKKVCSDSWIVLVQRLGEFYDSKTTPLHFFRPRKRSPRLPTIKLYMQVLFRTRACCLSLSGMSNQCGSQVNSAGRR